LSEIQVQYLYTRSYFKDVEIAQNDKKAFDYFLGQSKRYWLRNRRYMQGMIALELNRYDDKTVPPKIMKSLKENSLTSEEMGMYWKEMYEGYWWYDAPIESQALMVEAFDEVAHDTASVEDLKAWLLKSKQTQNWETTRSTAEACYALLLRGTKWLDHPSTVSIKLGDVTVDAAKPAGPAAPEAGTGYFKTSWSESDIKPSMGNITVTKGEAGVAWGAVYWQYFEQLDKITPHETPLKLAKQLFLEQNSPDRPENHAHHRRDAAQARRQDQGQHRTARRPRHGIRAHEGHARVGVRAAERVFRLPVAGRARLLRKHARRGDQFFLFVASQGNVRFRISAHGHARGRFFKRHHLDPVHVCAGVHEPVGGGAGKGGEIGALGAL
jgi:hypothetical protein